MSTQKIWPQMDRGEAYSIRPLIKDDIDPLRRLQAQLFPVNYTQAFYDRLFTEGNYAIVACLPSGEVVGVASARSIDTDDCLPLAKREGYLMTLGVNEAYRRLHIGSELLRRIIEVMKVQAKCTCITLHVKKENEAAQMFYHRHGFKPDPILGFVKDHYLIDGQLYDAYSLFKNIDFSIMESLKRMCVVL